MLVFDELMNGIDPESIDPAIEPESQNVEHRRPDLKVPPVEVGLLSEECMIVILAGRFIEGPSRPPELTEPVVGRRAARPWVAPDIPIPLGIRPRGSALHKPGMPA